MRSPESWRNFVAPVPHDRLLELIVETAAQVIHAGGASLFLIDTEKQELIFQVASGESTAATARQPIHLGHGIAGIVAQSGQAMAVSDIESDERLADDEAETAGNRAKSLLAVPLFYSDSVIGVLELLDKSNGESFTAGDMELLGLFAHLAGVAIAQSHWQQRLLAVLRTSARSPEGPAGEQPREDHGVTLLSVQSHAAELAGLIEGISLQGDDAFQAARQMLLALNDLLGTRSGKSA